jgi:hypothetical protein
MNRILLFLVIFSLIAFASASPAITSFNIDTSDAVVGTPVSFTLAASNPSLSSVSLTIDFGDGLLQSLDSSDANPTLSASHTYYFQIDTNVTAVAVVSDSTGAGSAQQLQFFVSAQSVTIFSITNSQPPLSFGSEYIYVIVYAPDSSNSSIATSSSLNLESVSALSSPDFYWLQLAETGQPTSNSILTTVTVNDSFVSATDSVSLDAISSPSTVTLLSVTVDSSQGTLTGTYLYNCTFSINNPNALQFVRTQFGPELGSPTYLAPAYLVSGTGNIFTSLFWLTIPGDLLGPLGDYSTYQTIQSPSFQFGLAYTSSPTTLYFGNTLNIYPALAVSSTSGGSSTLTSVTIDGPSDGLVNEPVLFTVVVVLSVASVSSNQVVLNLQFDGGAQSSQVDLSTIASAALPDGLYSYSFNATYTFSTVGAHSIALIYHLGSSISSSGSLAAQPLQIYIDSVITASIATPSSSVASSLFSPGVPFQFTGTVSNVLSQVSPLLLQWNFGDQSFYGGVLSTPLFTDFFPTYNAASALVTSTVSHIFPAFASSTINFTAQNGAGITSTDSVTIYQVPSLLSLQCSTPSSACTPTLTNSLISVQPTLSSTYGASTLTFSWGDGSANTVISSFPSSAPTDEATLSALTHKYTAAGTYTVTATIANVAGLTPPVATLSIPVIVVDAPSVSTSFSPVLTQTNTNNPSGTYLRANTAVSFVTSVTAPDDSSFTVTLPLQRSLSLATPDPQTPSVYYLAGGVATFTETLYLASTSSSSSLSVLVSTDSGFSGSFPLGYVAAVLPPTLSAVSGAPFTVSAGTPLVISYSYTNPSQLVLSNTIIWGNGPASSSKVSSLSDTLSPSNTFATAGSYFGTVILEDGLGTVLVQPFIVTVTASAPPVTSGCGSASCPTSAPSTVPCISNSQAGTFFSGNCGTLQLQSNCNSQ